MALPKVIITKTLPSADDLANRLRILGYDVIVMPLLEAEATGVHCPATAMDALIVTSSQAFRFLPPDFPRDLPLFAVGYGTASAARMHGFTDVRTSGGDVTSLGETVRAINPKGTWVHASATEPAEGTALALQGIGESFYSWPLYRTVPARFDMQCFQEGALVTVHSVKAARVLAEAVRLYDASETLQKMSLLCLSEAVLKCLGTSGFGQAYVADSPDEDALITKLAVALP